MTRFIALALCLLLSATSAAAHGGDDHDHEEEAAVAAPGGARLEVAGSNIELVAAIAGRELKIYVDRQATNEPIDGAVIAVTAAAFQPAPPKPSAVALIYCRLRGPMSRA